MKIYELTRERGIAASTAEALFDEEGAAGTAYWVDMGHPDEVELGRVLTQLHVHPLVLDNCMDPAASPPVAPCVKCLFLRLPFQCHWDDSSDGGPRHAVCAHRAASARGHSGG